MSLKRRITLYGFTAFAVLSVLSALTIRKTFGPMVVAPADLDGLVTVSTSPDKRFVFITSVPYKPKLWQRLLNSKLSGAFVVQEMHPTHSFSHSGAAHISYEAQILRVTFNDSSRFTFSNASKGSFSLDAEEVEYGVGLATYAVAGLSSHAAFIASHDWSKNSCSL